jgi:AGZA family xanthine/uracil permease-like MFS transporter
MFERLRIYAAIISREKLLGQTDRGNSMSEQKLEAAVGALDSVEATAGLDRYFEITERGSTISTEVLAGISTFLALSYIFVVNPAIMSQGGVPVAVSLFATIAISAGATLLMGLWARLPFAVSTGLEMNGYVVFTVIAALGFSWQQAFGLVFWSGALMTVVTVLSIRERVIDSIPDSLKIGLSFSVGMFLILIALKLSGILEYKGLMISGVGSLVTPGALCLYVGLAATLLLENRKIIGSVLISIVVVSIGYHLLAANGSLGFSEAKPDALPTISKEMFAGVGAFDLTAILNPKSISVVLVLFVLDFYGSVAKLIGLTLRTNLSAGGKLPGRQQALLVDGGGTMVSSFLGATSIVAFVESAVGIGAGARTGLSAVVCGALMAACFLLIPFIHYVPSMATFGALVFVGLRLCPTYAQWQAFPTTDKIALISMPLVTFATFSLDKAMLVGFVLAVVSQLIQSGKANPYLVGSAALLAISIGLQFTF